jgi:hypothetical protein
MFYSLVNIMLISVAHTTRCSSAQLQLESQRCLIKIAGALKTQRERGEWKSAIIYDDGVVVMQKAERVAEWLAGWLRTINFHMQYILFTSHNVSL